MADERAILLHVPADAARAAAIVGAVRAKGSTIDPVEAGTVQPDDGIKEAWLVIALWSPAATAKDDAASAAIAALARDAYRRGQYLGVTLDGADQPFGFGGGAIVDMGRWNGKPGKPLDLLVERVGMRMHSGPVGIAAPAKGPGRYRAWPLAAAVLVGLLVAAAWFLLGRDRTDDEAAPLRTALAALPCAWVTIDPVDDGRAGRLVLHGVADQPARADAVMEGLLRDRTPPVTVDGQGIARIDSAGCAMIDAARALRRDETPRLRLDGDQVGGYRRYGLAEARVVIDAPAGREIALVGIEPGGQVTWLLPDRAALTALAGQEANLTVEGDRHAFSLRSDHKGWTGLLLLTGDGPLPGALAQGMVQAPDAFAALVKAGTATGGWRTEMLWYHIDAAAKASAAQGDEE